MDEPPKLLILPILGLLVTLVLAPATGAHPPSDDPDPGNTAIAQTSIGEMPDPTKGIQTDQQSLAQDLALVAKSRGWTLEEAAADHKAAEVIGRIAAEVAAARPDIFVGSALSSEPGGTPELYIKGPADESVWNVVHEAEIDIKVMDNQPYSFAELEERKIAVHQALEEQGFGIISTGFSITGRGEISAGITRKEGLSDDPTEIQSRLPASLRADVVVTVNDVDIVTDESAFGGMRMRINGQDECTSGWSVWNASGTTGVTTAGHCGAPLNQIVDPVAGTATLTFQAEHRTEWGDVEWHTSNVLEPGQFYADANNIRYVNAVEPRASITQGESVCLYGRSSNVRSCLPVQNVSQTCTQGGFTTDRLVLMNGDVGIGGDSGGGWSFGNTAFGSHKGNCADVPGKEVFSVADLYDEALGVTVRVSQTLPTNGILWPTATSDDRLTSPDGRFVAAMQTDGNFVIYRTQPWTALWSTSLCGQTNFSGIHAVMQSDGNFVLYPSAGSPARWATSWAQTQPACISNQQTVFGSGVYMTLQNDGNLVMYKPGYGAVWASNTCCY